MVTYPENGLMQINQPHLSMLMLATLLSRFELRVPVVDQTGIQGIYDVQLEWLSANARPDAPDGPSIFTAVKEQLGLRLEAKKGPVQVLVIDHAEKTPIDILERDLALLAHSFFVVTSKGQRENRQDLPMAPPASNKPCIPRMRSPHWAEICQRAKGEKGVSLTLPLFGK